MENDVLVFGVSVVVMIAGLVQFAKKLGVRDNWSLALAMVLGPLLMVVNELAVMHPAISPWVRAVIVGLMCSLTASGLWDGAKALIAKARE